MEIILHEDNLHENNLAWRQFCMKTILHEDNSCSYPICKNSAKTRQKSANILGNPNAWQPNEGAAVSRQRLQSAALRPEVHSVVDNVTSVVQNVP